MTLSYTAFSADAHSSCNLSSAQLFASGTIACRLTLPLSYRTNGCFSCRARKPP